MNPKWREKARDELADIWVAASPEDRDLIEASVMLMEAMLQAAAHQVGESRSGDFRVIHNPPLTYWFRASPGNPVATVEHVYRPRRRK
jgi:hypothetical protein